MYLYPVTQISYRNRLIELYSRLNSYWHFAGALGRRNLSGVDSVTGQAVLIISIDALYVIVIHQ